MAEFVLPPNIVPSDESIDFVDGSTFSFTPQFGPGPTQRQQYASPRLRVQQSYRGLRLADKARMLSLIDNLQGSYHTLRAVVGFRLRGSFPATELLSNTRFDATTGLTMENANLVATVNDNILRLTRAGLVADYTAQWPVMTTVNGAVYVARVAAESGKGPMDFRLRLGTAAGGNQLGASDADITTEGLHSLAAAATGTSTHFSIYDGISGRSTDDFQEFTYASVQRAMLVNGAALSGANILNVDGLPTSTSGLLLRNTTFEVEGEVHRVTAALDSNSSGQGMLKFEPPLFRAVADNAVVIVAQPISRVILRGVSVTNKFGQYADIDLEMETLYE